MILKEKNLFHIKLRQQITLHEHSIFLKLNTVWQKHLFLEYLVFLKKKKHFSILYGIRQQ